MKHHLHKALIAICTLLLWGNKGKAEDTIKFATCADYPPFEYYDNGKITGFEVELGQLVAKELGKKAVFENIMPFTTILAAIQNGFVEAGISTITATEERRKNYDFSASYYSESLAVIYKKNSSIIEQSQLIGKKIACQLGTTMEKWLKQHIDNAEITLMDNNNQVIEALKAGHVEYAIMDEYQAKAFSEKNPNLLYTVIAQSDDGYAIAVKKGSPLKEEINAALIALEAKGEIQKLKQKWLHN
ncbi:MAG: ABC transporter substrate-binding protein [Holosporales bacterium]|jgi:polar amino acid transport system substrate-binding protein|nr:ABC transporter substrate-binding protein [Holosporales bacterium]